METYPVPEPVRVRPSGTRVVASTSTILGAVLVAMTLLSQPMSAAVAPPVPGRSSPATLDAARRPEIYGPGVAIDSQHAAGTLIGKRYVDALDCVEVLCTRGGDGSLTLDGAAMTMKQAKALPSSD